MFSATLFKQSFPVFQALTSPLIYLDNAATTQCPQAVIDAYSRFLVSGRGNAHRSSHYLSRQATELLERTRLKAAHFLGATDSEQIIFCRGSTEGINLLAYTLCPNLKPGDEILLSDAEHHANLVPWQLMANRYHLTLKFVSLRGNDEDVFNLQKALTNQTKIVSLTAASNVLGFKTPISKISTLCQSNNSLLIVDGAQLTAHETIDTQQLDCDFLVCSPHKFYGPTGVGLLYCKTPLLDHFSPWQGGGEMVKSVSLTDATFQAGPYRFEPGTSSLENIASLEACLDFINTLDRKQQRSHEHHLITYGHQALSVSNSIKIHSNSTNNVGILAFTLKDPNKNQDLANWLDEHHIAVRVGHHCAQPLLRAIGTPSLIRASIAGYNTLDDMNLLISEIQRFLSFHSKEKMTPSPIKPIDKNNSLIINEILFDDVTDLNLDALVKQNHWQSRYKMLLQWSKHIKKKNNLRDEKYLVNGCETNVWFYDVQDENDRFWFAIDSDSKVIKGLLTLLLVLTQGKTAQDIHAIAFDKIFNQLGLEKHLSPSRNNGIHTVLKKIIHVISQDQKQFHQKQ